MSLCCCGSRCPSKREFRVLLRVLGRQKSFRATIRRTKHEAGKKYPVSTLLPTLGGYLLRNHSPSFACGVRILRPGGICPDRIFGNFWRGTVLQESVSQYS